MLVDVVIALLQQQDYDWEDTCLDLLQDKVVVLLRQQQQD